MLYFVEGFFRDFRYALKRLTQRRRTALLALTSLALGIGVTTATFSVVDAVLLKPLPYRDSDRLVMVWNVNPQEGFDVEQARLGGSSMSRPERIAGGRGKGNRKPDHDPNGSGETHASGSHQCL